MPNDARASTPPDSTAWCRLEVAAAAAALQCALDRGLAHDDARARQAQSGRNAIEEGGGRSPWQLLGGQVSSTLVLVLVGAAAVSFAVGSHKDALAILAIVVLNVALGFLQEYRAERAVAALRRLAVPTVRVRRDGVVVEVSSEELVPGDIVLLEAGNLVPADGRVVESMSLRVQEAILTGESEAVEKNSASICVDGVLPLADQTNMVFMGTTVSYGRGLVLLTATGMTTELGRVASLHSRRRRRADPAAEAARRPRTNAGDRRHRCAHCHLWSGRVCRRRCADDVHDVSELAVAVIPEGLPAVVTIALALGAQRMLRRQALIRRLPAVETLGSVTVICSDKTGTLTENRMTVTVLDLAGHRLEVPEELKHRMPVTFGTEDPTRILRDEPSLSLLLVGGALCNDAVLRPDAVTAGQLHAIGDPTEAALVVAAARYGLLKDRLEAAYPRIAEVPFDSERKRMTTVHRGAEGSAWLGKRVALTSPIVFTKGAVDGLLAVCSAVWESGQALPMDANWQRRITNANEELARSGMRVLGVAVRFAAHDGLDDTDNAAVMERQLIFVGLVGMIDPPRREVRAAVAACLSAGIRPVMITGDHPVTARRIAEELGIWRGERVVAGSELAGTSAAELTGLVEGTSVFARVAPEQKLRIVEALQRCGHVVAMTGDGVNDAPALRRADIGVAMGITGTDVSKEAAAMVLLNDNFATIVSAVEEGRAINDNVRRFLTFSLAGNLGKVLLVFLGPLLGMPLPLLPFQILWLNLVTDGVLGLGIGVEPAERNAMRRPPQPSSAGILDRGLTLRVLWLGTLLGAVNLAVAWWAFSTRQPAWQAIVMSTVVLLQIVEAQVLRSWTESVFRLNPLTNRALLAGTGIVFLLQALVVYLPPLQEVFGTAPLAARQLAVPLIAAGVVLAAVEIAKRSRRGENAEP